MTPTVSIITGSYNLEDLILETVQAALGQTFEDFEYIIVDDGSTDATVARIESIRDQRLRLIKAPHSGLPAVGRNLALQQATGKYIAILDADDIWLPEKLARQVAFMEEYPSIGMVHTDYELLIDGRREVHTNMKAPPGPMSADEALRTLIRGNFVGTSSVMLRADALSLIDVFQDADRHLRGTEDIDLWLRLAEAGVNFGFIDERSHLYRIRSNSVSSRRLNHLMALAAALEKARERQNPVYQTSAFRRRLSYVYRNLGVCKIEAGERGGVRDIARAIALTPDSARAWAWLLLGFAGKTGITAFDRVRSARRYAMNAAEKRCATLRT